MTGKESGTYGCFKGIHLLAAGHKDQDFPVVLQREESAVFRCTIMRKGMVNIKAHELEPCEHKLQHLYPPKKYESALTLHKLH